MKNTFKKAVPAALLLSLILLSCANTEKLPEETEPPTGGGETTIDPEEDVTVFHQKEYNLNGETFTILSNEEVYGFYVTMDTEATTGENLDDAIYTRNRDVEELYNLKLHFEYGTLEGQLHEMIMTVANAGDPAYDAAYCAMSRIAAPIADEAVCDLGEIENLPFEAPWWEHSIIEQQEEFLDGTVYFAASDIHPMNLFAAQCILFNKGILANNDVNPPYDLVESGKWTFDKMREMVKQVYNLNGDETWKWTPSSQCIYGFSSYGQFNQAMTVAMGVNYVEKNEDGDVVFNPDMERFVDVVDTIQEFMNSQGEYVYANNGSFSYDNLFRKQMAAFIFGEIKAAHRMRDIEWEFGLLPLPKYNEEQENYITTTLGQMPVVCLPKSVKDPELSGAVLDALAYLSYKDVRPELYDTTVSQKVLRDEESTRMLDIICSTRYYNVAKGFGWTHKFLDNVENALTAGNANPASLVASDEKAVAKLIKDTLKDLK